MTLNLYKLYPQYQITADRRQQSVPVVQERRSGIDRRSEQRALLPSNVKKDIYSLKTSYEKTFAAFKGQNESHEKTSISFYRAVNELKRKAAARKEWINFATSPFPMVRRLVNIKNNQEDNNPVKAVGLGAVAALNVKEDVRDLLSIAGRVKSEAPSGSYVRYGFFVGTPIEKLLMKSEKLSLSIGKFDKTPAESYLGDKILLKLNVKPVIGVFKKKITHANGEVETVMRNYVKLEGPRLAKIVALTLYRMPQLSILVGALLELPKIFKTKKHDKMKQIANSGLSVILGSTCGAMLSATAAVMIPKAIGLPVMALGIGFYIGSRIAKGIGFKLNSTN